MGMKLSNSILGNNVSLIDDEVMVNDKVVYKGGDAGREFWSVYYDLVQLCGKACDEVIQQWLTTK